MKKLIKGALFFAIAGTVIVGCEKEDSIITTANQSNNQTKSLNQTQKSANSPVDLWLTTDSVGIYHNNYLTQATNYAVNNSTLNYLFILDEINYNLGYSEVEQDNVNNAVYNTTESERLTFLNENLALETYEVLIDLEDVIDQYPADYNAVNIGLNQVLSDLNFNQFSDFDTYLINGYAETLRSSAYFWYPTSTGGSASGDAYRVYRGDPVEDVPGLPGWAKADGRSFGWGLVWGTIYTANPGSGFAAGIISGVGGSLMYGR